MDCPLVSVVIPTYNRPHYLRLALASAVAQSYRNLEIIVHDNSSPQDIISVVAEFKDPRIRFFRNETNIGLTRNILAGIRKATGSFVALLGDDDLWSPEFVSKLVPPLHADRDVVVSFCDHDVIDSEGRLDVVLSEKWRNQFGRSVLRDGVVESLEEVALVFRSICIVSGAIIRRETIDWSRIPDDIQTYLDIYIAYALTVSGPGVKAYFVSDRLMQYRRHAAQQMTSDHRNRVANARSSLQFWSVFAHDPRVRNRAYFRCMCARKAVQILLHRLSVRDLTGLGEDLRAFYRMGLLDPLLIYYHGFYVTHLRRQGIKRLIP